MDPLTAANAGGAINAVRGEVVDRVYEASGIVSEGLAYLKVKHIIVFPSTWLLFFLLGRWFFDNVLGRYHATSSRVWAIVCKGIFLLTFVAACNLIQLTVADVYGFMHPTLRNVAWTSTLSLLCILLNTIIPFMSAVSMGRTLGLPRILAGFLGLGTILVFQLWFFFIAETFIVDKSETWKDHNDVLIVVFLYRQLFLKDLEHSVAITAMMGTFCSAIVAGFATISFPMDQLMIFRGVDEALLRRKKATHVEVLSMIAERKKTQKMAQEKSGSPSSSTSSSFAFPPEFLHRPVGVSATTGVGIGNGAHAMMTGASTADIENDHDKEYETDKDKGVVGSGGEEESLLGGSGGGNVSGNGNDIISGKNRTLSGVNLGGIQKRITHKIDQLGQLGAQITTNITNTVGVVVGKNPVEFRLELFRDLYRTNNYLVLFYRKAQGVMKYIWTHIDSIVDHIIINVRRLWARQSYVAYQWPGSGISGRDGRDPASKDIAILETMAEDIFSDIVHSHELHEQAEFAATKCGKMIWWCGVCLSLVGTIRLYFAFSHVLKSAYFTFIETDPSVVPDEETAVDMFMSMLNMSPQKWELSLNFLMIFSLGAFQVRAFLGSMMIAARLGFLSTNTELYALVLAYLSGFYFIASVVLLRTQLPIEYRKGVTLALGQFSFDYFEWLFDRIYIFSSALSFGLLWWYNLRKKNVAKRFYHHDV